MVSSEEPTPEEDGICPDHEDLIAAELGSGSEDGGNTGPVTPTVIGCFETVPVSGGLAIISYRGGTLNYPEAPLYNYPSTYQGEPLDPACPADVNIPAQLNGQNVVTIGGGWNEGTYGSKMSPFGLRGVTSLVIPNTVTTIRGIGSIDASNITIPSSVTNIDRWAFMDSSFQYSGPACHMSASLAQQPSWWQEGWYGTFSTASYASQIGCSSITTY